MSIKRTRRDSGRARRLRRLFGGEAGFMLPFVTVMIGLAVAIIAGVALVDTHFRSIAKAGEGDRLYYALDAGIEAVLADLVRGADATSPSYTSPQVTLNEITASISVTTPGTGTAPAPIQQYFDPGLRNPQLLRVPSVSSYLLHIPNMRAGPLEVNWAFDVAATTADPPQGTFTLKVLSGVGGLLAGGGAGCPDGTTVASTSGDVTSAGSFNLTTGSVTISQAGTYSIAFCVVTLTKGAMTTRSFKPTGAATDTWVYATAYKDYQVTTSAMGANVTAYVRQMPGPTKPPAGNWAANNISWITNLVTPYQWDR